MYFTCKDMPVFIVHPTERSAVAFSWVYWRVDARVCSQQPHKQRHHNTEFVQPGTVRVLLYFGCPLPEGTVIGVYCRVAPFLLSTIPCDRRGEVCKPLFSLLHNSKTSTQRRGWALKMWTFKLCMVPGHNKTSHSRWPSKKELGI